MDEFGTMGKPKSGAGGEAKDNVKHGEKKSEKQVQNDVDSDETHDR